MLSSLYTLLLGALILYVISRTVESMIIRYKLKEIPDTRVLGASWPGGGYYYQVVKFLLNARTILRDEYSQHLTAGGAWKVPEMKGWHVVISQQEMIREMMKASDEVLDAHKAFDKIMSFSYTIGDDLFKSAHHAQVVQGPLTRSIGIRFGEVYEEICEAFRDEIPPQTEWKSVLVSPMIRRVVSRTSNRLFVGLPLCRNTTWLNLNIDFTVDLIKAAIILDLFPPFLRSWIALFLREVPQKIKMVKKILEPIIQERLEMEKKFGKEWDGRPNDLFSWLLDHAPGEYKTVHDMTIRILFINFGAIHTTSSTFTAALLNLIAYPEYIQPLREEIEAAVEEFGWTKTAMGKMIKLDSFLKETMRMNTLSCFSVTRKVVKDFTFSNGTRVPSGTLLSVAADAIHHDEFIYSDHTTFNGFRFSELKQSSQGDLSKLHMITLSPEFLLFGLGRHGCPGRFFAVNELKALVAHILVTYDIKAQDERWVLPEPRWFGPNVLPDEIGGYVS